ncbi:MAG: hypothetical protein UR26_C0003G0030 [candidate division TM6 bacterium GW2011_GWF2_32_72]|nr:MAG: hypothetical protein UR26_C0003G0030 [candidate division TM6 bacterium GW2011_GWF2_32_72]
MKKKLFVFPLLVTILSIDANFLLPSNGKNKVTVSSLREDIGNNFEVILKKMSECLGVISEFQPFLVDQTKELVVLEKGTFMADASKEQLEEYLKSLDEVKKRLDEMVSDLNQDLKILKKKVQK